MSWIAKIALVALVATNASAESSIICHSERSICEAKNLKDNNRDSSVASLSQNDKIKANNLEIAEFRLDSATRIDSAKNALDSANHIDSATLLPKSAESAYAPPQQEIAEFAESNLDSATFPTNFIKNAESTSLSFFYNATFGYILDNIEETMPFWQTRTIHAISASLQGGFSIEDEVGAHNIVFGGYGAQFMGARHAFNATGGIFAYYHYAHRDFNAYLGIFPRKALKGAYPRSFFRDDYVFLNPQISGALLQYQNSVNHAIKGYAEAAFEHFGANLKDKRDEFYALFGGEVKIYDTLAIGAQGALYHHQDESVVGADGAGTFLVDRALYSAYIGFDARGFTQIREIFDVLELKVALLGQSERKRAHSGMLPFYNGVGGEVSVKAQYKGFGLEDIYYFGKGQMRYFGDYGERFYAGLPLYQGTFNTISAFYEYKNDFLSVRVGLRFYNIDKRLSRLAHQQFVNFSFDLDRLLKKRKITL